MRVKPKSESAPVHLGIQKRCFYTDVRFAAGRLPWLLIYRTAWGLRWALRTRGRRLPRRAVTWASMAHGATAASAQACSAPGTARRRHHRSARKVWPPNAMAELTNLPCLVLSCCVVSCLVLYCRVLCGVVLICVVLYVLWCRAMSTPSETGSCLCVCVCWGMYACMCRTPDADRLYAFSVRLRCAVCHRKPRIECSGTPNDHLSCNLKISWRCGWEDACTKQCCWPEHHPSLARRFTFTQPSAEMAAVYSMQVQRVAPSRMTG